MAKGEGGFCLGNGEKMGLWFPKERGPLHEEKGFCFLGFFCYRVFLFFSKFPPPHACQFPPLFFFTVE